MGHVAQTNSLGSHCTTISVSIADKIPLGKPKSINRSKMLQSYMQKTRKLIVQDRQGWRRLVQVTSNF